MSDRSTYQANSVVHFDISGADDGALQRFYGDLLNWHVALGIAVEDLERTASRATELGGTVHMPPTDNGWVTKAQIKDPAGNILTLIQR